MCYFYMISLIVSDMMRLDCENICESFESFIVVGTMVSSNALGNYVTFIICYVEHLTDFNDV